MVGRGGGVTIREEGRMGGGGSKRSSKGDLNGEARAGRASIIRPEPLPPPFPSPFLPPHSFPSLSSIPTPHTMTLLITAGEHCHPPTPPRQQVDLLNLSTAAGRSARYPCFLAPPVSPDHFNPSFSHLQRLSLAIYFTIFLFIALIAKIEFWNHFTTYRYCHNPCTISCCKSYR